VQYVVNNCFLAISAVPHRRLLLDTPYGRLSGTSSFDGSFGIEAAKAKLFASDMAMRVTTDAVHVLGGYGYGYGYVADHPVERYMREAKALQIVEGTNQIQRMVISRSLTRG
jgi:alkylation response protein AidB-like acyl-CoA dehydrogenase